MCPLCAPALALKRQTSGQPGLVLAAPRSGLVALKGCHLDNQVNNDFPACRDLGGTRDPRPGQQRIRPWSR